jgi:prepilin-type N-terminal cleavage/methylation domain-containing protein
MRQRQRGFTLIELMVSLVIFSFAIAGVLSVAVSMAQGFREQRQAVAAEDNVRAAMDFISDAVRSMSPLVTQGGTIYDNDSCKQWQQAGLAGTCVNDVNCPNANKQGNQTGAPDAMRMVFASGGVVTSITDPGGYVSCAPAVTLVDASGISAGDLLLIGDIASNSGEIASVASVAGNVVTLNACLCAFGKTYAQKSLAVRVQRAKFYVDTYDGVPNILLMDTSPKAFSEAYLGATAPAEPLAENVEDFQVAYGLDTTNGGAGSIPPGPVTAWEYASGVGNTAGALRAIRITIITTTAAQLQGGTASFLRPAAEDRAASGTADKYRRRILTSTVEVRNFGGSP